ncbi:MAG: hypothetical protein JWP28_2794 [Phenylobacterium sp.]|uniref:hypothetical protein n=1 Tax=Phenylobacterium sp. TaxID=1871053 RepID=UPI0026265348|nr:hypothetical protein [Phenylobacterium sp.]MDB5498763.1 hypothetical protein [Phenylobacterium sp.]
MVSSQHLRRWSALVVATSIGAALLAYVVGGLVVVLGHWRWAPRTALLSVPVLVALALWPASKLAPKVTRSQRIWGWWITLALAYALLAWMMIESRMLARA